MPHYKNLNNFIENLEKITSASKNRSHAMTEDTPPTGAKKKEKP